MTDSSVDVLRFWRNVEIFNIPTTPKRERNERLSVEFVTCDDPLPWQTPRPSAVTKNAEWSHAVFLGVSAMRQWTQAVMAVVCPNEVMSEEERQRLAGDGWIAAFVVDDAGQMVSDSYVPASFALGARRLLAKRSLDGLNEDIKEQVQAFKERCPASTAQPIGWPELQREQQHLAATFGAVFADLPLDIIVKSTLRPRQCGDEGKAQSDVDFLNSFYLNDLDLLISVSSQGKRLGSVLAQYLGTPSAARDRQDILTQPRAMVRCLAPHTLSMGRWPASSSHHLMLAQQASVGQIITQLQHSNGLVAVNGPPGTGKTTLLCDVVADIVVQRAHGLSRLNGPGELFGNKTIIGGMAVFPLRADIVDGTGIVVTSNNNTAVENITRELPAMKKIATQEYSTAGYFNEVAMQVFAAAEIKDPAWGLVAAALGNSDNRSKFAKAFFQDGKSPPYQPGQPCDLKTLLEKPPVDAAQQWKNARQAFIELHDKVNATKQLYKAVADAVAECEVLRTQAFELSRAIEDQQKLSKALPGRWTNRLLPLEAEDKACTTRLKQAVESEQRARLAERTASDRLENALSDIQLSLWDRILKKLGHETKRYRTWMRSLALLRSHRADTTEAYIAASQLVERSKNAYELAQRRFQQCILDYQQEKAAVEAKLQQQQLQLKQTQSRNQQLLGQIQAFKATGAKVPDAHFFSLDSDKQHLASAWIDPTFDALRARLFLAALRLHEATLLAINGKAIANLRAFTKMLLRNTPEPVAAADLGVLWNILFFTVPVVSSTLASFDRLFAGLGCESLGWLLIDEAGQATPHSVAGALWRSKRAVIIGDPLQIEPVMTVPRALVAELRKRDDVDVKWSPVEESAQTLADRTMRLGAWIGEADSPARVWTGMPLRAHRRCIEPMFSVANTIAYAEQMVQANTEPAPFTCVLGESAWLDVPASASNGQVVPDEMKCLEAQLLKLRANWPTTKDDERANVFVISPFKKVAEECSILFKRLAMYKKDWPVDWGTVHRFQGKEAEIVIIVLGSAPGQAGSGSRNWASLKPNLLNVAVTRAKQRVYVIGNRKDWAPCPQFKTLAEALA